MPNRKQVYSVEYSPERQVYEIIRWAPAGSNLMGLAVGFFTERDSAYEKAAELNELYKVSV